MLWRQPLLGEKFTTENDRQNVDSSSTGYKTFLLPCCRSASEQENAGNKWHEGYTYLRTRCVQAVAGTFILLIIKGDGVIFPVCNCGTRHSWSYWVERKKNLFI